MSKIPPKNLPIPLPLYSGSTDNMPIYPRGLFPLMSFLQMHKPIIFPSSFRAYSWLVYVLQLNQYDIGNFGMLVYKEVICVYWICFA